MDYQTAALALAVVVAGILVVRLSRVGSRESFLPPGPKTMPILGNLHQLPLKYAHIQFTKWAREFGGIYSLKASDKTIVVITGAAPPSRRQRVELMRWIQILSSRKR